MQQKNKHIIYVATKEELMNESYYRRLWMATCNIDLSRRSWLDRIANALRDYDGAIMHRCGLPYEIPCVDEAFGDDPDMRWLGYYKLSDGTGLRPKMMCRKFHRLQLLDLYFRICHPNIARHFGRSIFPSLGSGK